MQRLEHEQPFGLLLLAQINLAKASVANLLEPSKLAA